MKQRLQCIFLILVHVFTACITQKVADKRTAKDDRLEKQAIEQFLNSKTPADPVILLDPKKEFKLTGADGPSNQEIAAISAAIGASIAAIALGSFAAYKLKGRPKIKKSAEAPDADLAKLKDASLPERSADNLQTAKQSTPQNQGTQAKKPRSDLITLKFKENGEEKQITFNQNFPTGGTVRKEKDADFIIVEKIDDEHLGKFLKKGDTALVVVRDIFSDWDSFNLPKNGLYTQVHYTPPFITYRLTYFGEKEWQRYIDFEDITLNIFRLKDLNDKLKRHKGYLEKNPGKSILKKKIMELEQEQKTYLDSIVTSPHLKNFDLQTADGLNKADAFSTKELETYLDIIKKNGHSTGLP